jgi:hypothetical protein
MNVIIFTGPTLSAEAARSELEATYLPPAAQGDVYRATISRPVAIGIIDGVFDQVPSVWHKEILWAMSEGIQVFGSASMGALRAAELAAFGMNGVGEIFSAYQSGFLEDDDEVAVVHGTREDGFRAVSDAMVNIRQTLVHAEGEGVISPFSRFTLERIAKNLCYPDRSYVRMLELAVQSDLPASELDALRNWLPKGRVDQKRLDALEMLREMRAAVENVLQPKVVDYKFENTVVWNSLVNSAGFLHGEGDQGDDLSTDEILAELWANPELCLQAYQYATIRHLVRQAAQLSGIRLPPEKIAAAEDAFRADRGIKEQPDFERWLDRHHMTPAEFAELVEHEALQHGSSLTPSPFPHRWMVDWLRISGQFDTVASDALAKKNAVVEQISDSENREVTTEALLQWYVEQLASPAAPGRVSSLAALPYLRSDWDAFLGSIVKQHRLRAAECKHADGK